MFRRGKRFEEAVGLFDRMKTRNVPLDTIAYMAYIRAVGFVLPWKATFAILDVAYETLGSTVISVAETAMINLKYRDYSRRWSGDTGEESPVEKVAQVINWLEERDLDPTSKTMDVALAVACEHGSISDVRAALGNIRRMGFTPTEFTFNTLLDR